MKEPIIKVNQLSKVYNSRSVKTVALDQVDLEVHKGDFISIMGPSGAGKTTLLNLIASIDRPTSGKIIFKGKDISQLNHKDIAGFRRDHIGFLFQDFNLLNNMTIKDNICLPLSLQGMHHVEIKTRLTHMASFLNIEDQLEKYPYQLSGGQKQRAAAGRALITRPTVILADEPTGALDSKSATTFLKYLQRMNEDLGATIIMVTHDAFTASFSQEIIFIKDGQIHTKLQRPEKRRDFYNSILDLLASMGGGVHELD